MAIDRKSLGTRIKKLRNNLGLTQASLAERAELDIGYLAQLERGLKAPSLDALSRIADALKVKPGFLLDGGKLDKDDALVRELRDLVAAWTPKQRSAVIRALRALSEL